MKKADKLKLGLVLIFVLLIGLIGWQQQWFSSKPIFSVTRHLRFTLEARNSSNQYIKDNQIKVFLPALNDPQQEIIKIDSSLPYQIESDSLGNQTLVVDSDLAPYGLLILSVQLELKISEHNPKQEIEPQNHLMPQRWIESDHPQIKTLASELAISAAGNNLKTDKAKMQANYDYVRSKIAIQEFVREERGALHALQNKRGDCTEMSFLIAALGRAQAIPTRVVAGFVTYQNSKLRAANYHNWAEAYWDQRWHIIDAQKGVFDQGYTEYVTFRYLDRSQPEIGSQRFVASNPAVELKLN